jgi:hypothetical protein
VVEIPSSIQLADLGSQLSATGCSKKLVEYQQEASLVHQSAAGDWLSAAISGVAGAGELIESSPKGAAGFAAPAALVVVIFNAGPPINPNIGIGDGP